MLIKCPECELQVSDKAIICPHCGFPLDKKGAKGITKKPSKHKRLPNGFGQISEIKGRALRRPFRAMVTVGTDAYGRPKCKILKPEGYFATYNEAYAALVEYNKDPYELDSTLTMEKMFDMWYEEVSKTKTPSTCKNLTSSWKYARDIYEIRVADIRCRHLKMVFAEGTIDTPEGPKHLTPSTKITLKSLMNVMFDYAVENEYTDKNYARMLSSTSGIYREKEDGRKSHFPYTKEEIQKVWDHIDEFDCADILLIQCYSGWRPKELCNLKLTDVDLEQWTFTGGIKTAAGKDRIVPIHSRIRPLVQRRYDEAVQLGSEWLFNIHTKLSYKCGTNLTYNRYSIGLTTMYKILNINLEHRPHDGRTHFVTAAKEAEVDEYAIKYIIGHEIRDLTERVYTSRTVDWLVREIEKIP